MNTEDQNTHYIQKFLDGIYTRKDAEQFLDLIKKDSDNEDLEKHIDEVWMESAFATSTSPIEYLEYKNRALNLIEQLRGENKVEKRAKSRKIIYAVASIAAIFIIAFLGIRYYNGYVNSNLAYVSVNSSFGERKEIILPDGSTVYLNSCSQLSYPQKFAGDKRLVELNGQAYFKVSKNKKQPFIIKTHQFDVKVLGTEFDVKAYNGDEIFAVNVENGKVEVDMPDATIRLTAKELVELNSLTKDYSKYKEDANVAVWRSGSLRFNKTPIRDVVKEIERSYNYRIDFSPEYDFDNLITGEHSNKDLITILKSIELTSGIHYTIEEQDRRVVLYK